MRKRVDRSLSQRVEESALGRGLISLFLAMTIFSVVVWNLPPSEMKSTIRPAVSSYVRSAGLSQSWRLFAPVLRRRSVDLVARVEYADGSEFIWRPPDGDLLDSYRSYRWRKWAAELRQDGSEPMWAPAAMYIARLSARDGALPTSVTLVRRWADLPDPGSRDEPVWEEFEFYTLDLQTDGRAGG